MIITINKEMVDANTGLKVNIDESKT